MPSGRILIIDDDPEVGAFTSEVAQNLGLQALRVDRSEQVVAAFREFHPDTIVLDLMMPGMDGIQVLKALADENCQADILLFSGADGRLLNTTARLAAQQGLRIRELLRKPVQIEDLELALRRPARAAAASSEDELRSAIAGGQIIAHFQPKVRLQPSREWIVDGVEALARWNHPKHGLIPPAAFIPLAEQTDLIRDLTEAIADRALGLARRLRRDGTIIDIAMNLSPRILDDEALPDRLARKVEDNKLDPGRLILEVTESAAMTDGIAMESLARIRVKGMKLSMDDFGTGYSSLIQLHRMPFSELKIDRSFVMEADTDAEARVIIQATVRLAQSLGLRVCAEGVESRKSLSFLRSIGCDQAQGYLISKPLPEDDFLAFLRTCRQARDPGVAAG